MTTTEAETTTIPEATSDPENVTHTTSDPEQPAEEAENQAEQEHAQAEEAGAQQTEEEERQAEPESEEDSEPPEDVTKIVIWIRPGITTIAVQHADTDPEFTSLPSEDLDKVLAAVPQTLEDAQAKWNVQPKRQEHDPNPAERPTPRPFRRPTAEQPQSLRLL